jgi:hypothetical protein
VQKILDLPWVFQVILRLRVKPSWPDKNSDAPPFEGAKGIFIGKVVSKIDGKETNRGITF